MFYLYKGRLNGNKDSRNDCVRGRRTGTAFTADRRSIARERTGLMLLLLQEADPLQQESGV